MSDTVITNSDTFSELFDLVISKTIASELYKNIEEQFNKHKIDSNTYVELINNLNSITLQEARQAGIKAVQLRYEAEALDKKLAQEAEVTTARAKLIERQKDGFDENLLIKLVESTGNQVGMIESGGLNAPQALWDNSFCAINELQYVARKKYEDDTNYPTCSSTPITPDET